MLCINMFFPVVSQLSPMEKYTLKSVLLRRSYLGLRFPLLRRSLLRLHLRPQLFQHLAQLVLSLPLLRIFRNTGIR